MARSWTVVAGALAGWLLVPPWQDPAPAPPPASPPQESAAGRPKPHPLEGVYELRRRVMNGKPDLLPSRGYLAITQRHLFLYFAAPGPDRDLPLVRAGVRTWRPEGVQVKGVVQLGWYTDTEGGVHVERPGTEELRRIELVRGGVRVVQDERSWLEFERVE